MINIHILGESGHAGRKHREAIEQLPELYTITDYDDADIIDICTPNYLHFEQACEALYHDKSCIIEKPFCKDSQQLFDLSLNEINSRGRAYPVLNYRTLKLDSYSATWQRSPDYYSGWRGKLDTALGGVILSHGIHLIDHAICQFGDVRDVQCATWSDPRYACEVETRAEISLHFESGLSLDMLLEISPDCKQDAPDNPGFKDFFRNFDMRQSNLRRSPNLSEMKHLQEVLDACYAEAMSDAGSDSGSSPVIAAT